MAINKRTKRKQVSGHKKIPWSKKEDEQLLDNINKYLKNHKKIIWTKVGVPGRNFKQCKERYENQLNPNINKSDFTNVEINIIIQKQKEFGNKWKKISSFLNNRTDGQVKNKWYSIKNNIKKDNIIESDYSNLIDLKPDTFSQQVINNNNDIIKEYDLDDDDWNIYDPDIFDDLKV